MATPTWITLANANQASQINVGTAVSSFTSATDVSPGTNVAGQAFQTQPAQLFPGQMWRFTANGIYSSTSSPGISLGVYYGGAAGSPLCYGSVPSTLGWSGAASIPWTLQAMGKTTSVGTSGAWNVVGFIAGLQPVTAGATGLATSAAAVTPMPQYTAVAQYDTSTAKLITIAATCTSSSASNAITCYNWAIEYMTEP